MTQAIVADSDPLSHISIKNPDASLLSCQQNFIERMYEKNCMSFVPYSVTITKLSHNCKNHTIHHEPYITVHFFSWGVAF
jgi:hypothetical protein